MSRIKQGEIYRLYEDSAGKPRPVVIVSRDELNHGLYVVAVQFYSQQLEKRRQEPFCVFFGAGAAGLEYDCVAKADEISSIAKTEINLAAGPIGIVDKKQLARIFAAIDVVLGR